MLKNPRETGLVRREPQNRILPAHPVERASHGRPVVYSLDREVHPDIEVHQHEGYAGIPKRRAHSSADCCLVPQPASKHR
jgi:hypothetical protein